MAVLEKVYKIRCQLKIEMHQDVLEYSDASLQMVPLICLKYRSSHAPDIYMFVNRAHQSALFNQVRRLLAERALFFFTLPKGHERSSRINIRADAGKCQGLLIV